MEGGKNGLNSRSSALSIWSTQEHGYVSVAWFRKRAPTAQTWEHVDLWRQLYLKSISALYPRLTSGLFLYNHLLESSRHLRCIREYAFSFSRSVGSGKAGWYRCSFLQVSTPGSVAYYVAVLLGGSIISSSETCVIALAYLSNYDAQGKSRFITRVTPPPSDVRIMVRGVS